MKTWIIKIIVGHVIVLALILAVLGNKFGWFTPDNEPEARLNCPVFSEGCTFNFEGQSYKVNSQAPLNANKPVQLQVEGKAKQIHASWQMQGMEMGPNRYRLLSNDQQHWHAQTALPICTNKRQDWLLKLEIDGHRIDISTVSEKI
ncbi:hypothetical protein [Iodobacter fluviatilis]|jgi:hypothetical protein|uniref:Uncharacterized protein n=1 Tax=Iodobacter fluviatilis TaxID=537 RepID=A0A7G3G6E8_9NEIS|nr:hypothetical protein [Iodobacter fluviatilis]QBC42658.1 hypothetical protein C1H71_03195 [Iodobacter fluviatilis]